MTILKSKEFKAATKPSNPVSFWWFVHGYIEGTKPSSVDFWALRRYQRMGSRVRKLKFCISSS
jgi:hypothetical protein